MFVSSKNIRRYVRFFPSFLRRRLKFPVDVVDGYDKWAEIYDREIEIGNVTVFYNDILVSEILNHLQFPIRFACDFGAGTGRHYEKIMQLNPQRWIGCDVSSGMLKKLQQNIPNTETYILTDHTLPFAKDSEIDFMFSSLTLGHVKDIEPVLKEWNRVLCREGHVLLTLFHPELAYLKTARSFKNPKGEVYAIEHYQHELTHLRNLFTKLDWEINLFDEKVIDSRIKPVLDRNNLSDAYPNIEGKSIVCGFLLQKN